MSSKLPVLFLGWILLVGRLFGADAPQRVVLIVSAISTLKAVSLKDAQAYFELRRTAGPDGSPISVAMREPGPERDAVLALVFKESDAQVSRYFMQAIYNGSILAAPTTIEGADATKKFVASNPRAIGYILQRDMDGSVRALTLDGKTPSSAGYPLVIASN